MGKLPVWIAAIAGSILYFYLMDITIMKAFFGNTIGFNLFPK